MNQDDEILPLVQSSQRTVIYSGKYKYFFLNCNGMALKYVCESQSNVSGTEPWTFHVSEVVQGQGVRFVILGNLEACQKYYPAESCDRESSLPGGDTPFFTNEKKKEKH